MEMKRKPYENYKHFFKSASYLFYFKLTCFPIISTEKLNIVNIFKLLLLIFTIYLHFVVFFTKIVSNKEQHRQILVTNVKNLKYNLTSKSLKCKMK